MTSGGTIAAGSRERAADAAAVLGVRRRRRVRGGLYHLYVAVLAGVVYGILADRTLSTAIGPGLSASAYGRYWPAALLLVAGTVVRSAAWQGPIAFSAADVAFLLSAPIAGRDLVRGRLWRVLAAAAAAGAVIGGIAALTSRAGVAGLGGVRCAGVLAGFTAAGAGAAALSWIVERSAAVSRAAVSTGPLLLAGGVLLALAGSLGAAAGRAVTIWSGPWGWIVAPLAGVRLWWLGTALVAASGLACAGFAVRHPEAPNERFLAQATTRGGIAGGIATLDYRSALLTQRDAVSRARGGARARGSRRRPRRASLAIVWRDWTALARTPARAGWATALTAAATFQALAHPGRILPALLAAALLYTAASTLCEPLRVDVDYPDRTLLLTGRGFSRALREHSILPAAVLTSVVTATLLVCVAAGAVTRDPRVLWLIPLGILVALLAVQFAALSARRGGRLSPEASLRVITAAASDPSGVSAVLMIAPWAIAALVGLSAPILIAGHAVLAHGSVAQGWIVAAILAAAVAAGLHAVLRAGAPPA